ncbi:MAG: hypothetical protein U5K76_11270 [Woeseiaceae bacterium]|nr:hypothetical protein [Woeseiaceae bacterium]
MLNTRVRLARPPVLSFTGLFALLLLVACGLSAEERLARGQTAYTDGEFRAAAIDARSVLQAEPDNAEARLLLGRAALEIGDLGSADKELRRAIELGVPKGRVAVDLGRLLLAQQQHQQLLDELTPEVQAAADEPVVVMRLRAEAHLGLGNTVEARELYQAVLAADDRDLQAMLGIVFDLPGRRALRAGARDARRGARHRRGLRARVADVGHDAHGHAQCPAGRSRFRESGGTRGSAG